MKCNGNVKSQPMEWGLYQKSVVYHRLVARNEPMGVSYVQCSLE
jgi:hypothetical protein